MILDTKEQKDLLIQILNSVNIPVSAIEQVYQLKKELEAAAIQFGD